MRGFARNLRRWPSDVLRDAQLCVMVCVAMIDFRREIKREMKRLGWSAYRLAKESGMPIRGVQQYIEGTRDATGERLSKMLKALGFELKRSRKRGR